MGGIGFFLNPTIKTATVKQVVVESPAGTAGIVEGHEILEVEGHTVPGSKADAIAPLMEKGVGRGALSGTSSLITKDVGFDAKCTEQFECAALFSNAPDNGAA